jgi:hypothetical protein
VWHPVSEVVGIWANFAPTVDRRPGNWVSRQGPCKSHRRRIVNAIPFREIALRTFTINFPSRTGEGAQRRIAPGDSEIVVSELLPQKRRRGQM